MSAEIGLGIKWVPRVWTWISQNRAKRREILSEVNAVLTQDPEDLARLYVEPDVQPLNPANSADDMADEEDGHFRTPAYKWLDSFLVKPRMKDGRHVAFILSDAGMGKSSLLAMLKMTSAAGFWPGIHFELFKLGPESLSEIKKINYPYDTVLLLDSLDEDLEAFGRIKDRIGEILRVTQEFRQVIITCRTQFFPLQSDFERHGARIKIGGFTCKMVFLSLFSEIQVDTYLEKIYSESYLRAQAKKLVMSMESLRMRPMLLAHIEDLMDRRDDDIVWTRFTTHRELVESWLDREQRKKNSKIKANELRDACHTMAIHLQQQGRRMISPENLDRVLRRANLSDVIKRVEEFGGRSLLNRNSDGDYRFAHYSIQEFLVVDHMARYPGLMEQYTAQIRYTDELVAFLVSWTNEAPSGWGAILGGANLSDADLSHANLFEVYLRVAKLHRANFENSNLKRANLTKADLREANLRNVDFEEAQFVEAQLQRASITLSILRGADFRGADLSGADLKDSDLCDANFDKAVLNGADLQGALNLTQRQLSVALGDYETALPAGLERPGGWKKT